MTWKFLFLYLFIAVSLMAEEKIWTIAVVQSGNSRFTEPLLEQFNRELAQLLGNQKYQIQTEEFNAEWNPLRYPEVLGRALTDPQVDIILAPSIFISEEAAKWQEPLSKPVIGAFIPKDDLFSLRYSKDDHSSVPNMTFAMIKDGIIRDLYAFQRLGNFNVIHLVVDKQWLSNNQSDYKLLQKAAKELGFKVELIASDMDLGRLLKDLDRPLEAVFLSPFERLDESGYQSVIDHLTERRIPTFSVLGYSDLPKGVLAARTEDLVPLLAKRSAINVQQIIQSEKPEDLLLSLPIKGKMKFSSEVAEVIGFTPSFEAFLEFQKEGDPMMSRGALISLEQAMCYAMLHSHDLPISHAEAVSASHDAGILYSLMRPQLFLKSLYYRIDTNTAEHFLGLIPKERSTVGLHLAQMIYDDQLISTYRASKKIYQSAKYQEMETLFSVLYDAGEAYLNFWSSTALLNIERENYRLTQKNLATARLRLDVGAGGPEDVYRWESEEAQRKAALIARETQLDQAQTELNRLFGLPFSTQWRPLHLDIEDIESQLFGGVVKRLVLDKQFENHLIDSSIQLGKEMNPRLLAINELIAGKRIICGQLKREPYLPKVYANFDYNHQLHHRNISSVVSHNTYSENDWFAVVSVTIPFIQGGAHCHKVNQCKAELTKYCEEKKKTGEIIESMVANSIYALKSSYPAMWLSRVAADQAEKNFKLVQQNYGAGSASIVDLIDAQSQFRIQEENALLSIIQYFRDLLNFQRSLSWFEFLNDDIQRNEWRKRFGLDLGNQREAQCLRK